MKKRILLIATFLLTMFSAMAEDWSAGVEFAYDFNYLRGAQGKMIQDMPDLHGLHLGPVLRCDLDCGVGFSASLLYQFTSMTDSKKEKDLAILGKTMWVIDRYQTHSLELPLRVIYEYDITDDWAVFVFGGPSFNFAVDWLDKYSINLYDKEYASAELHLLSGKYKFKVEGEDVITGQEDADIKWFDIGLGAGFGFKFRMARISASYDWGLLNISNEQAYGPIYNNQFKLAVGVFF